MKHQLTAKKSMKCTKFARTVILSLLVFALYVSGCISSQAAESAKGRRLGVIVGCIQPKNDSLTAPLSDALLMKRVLEGPGQDISLLLSDDSADAIPTRENILKALNDKIKQAGPNDSVWFYYSGHGGATQGQGRSFILPYGFKELKDVIFISDIREMLQTQCKAKTKVVIIDACQSGSTRAYPLPNLEQTFGNYKGVITLAGCKVNEGSMELGKLGHGVFTFFLVKGLASEDPNQPGKPRTIKSLHEYVTKEINKCLSEAYKDDPVSKPQQTPVFLPEELLTSNGAIGIPNPNLINSLPQPPYGDATPMTPLAPGVIPIVRVTNENSFDGANVAMTNVAESVIREQLRKTDYPIIAREQAVSYEALLNSPDTVAAAQQAERLMSRFILRARVDISTDQYDIENQRVCKASVTVTVEVIDAYSMVCAIATSDNPDGTPFSSTAFSPDLATRRAVTGATKRAMNEAIQIMEKTVKPRFNEKTDAEENNPQN